MSQSSHVNSALRTIGEYLVAGTRYLVRHGVSNPRVVCELLASRLFKCPRLDLFLHEHEVPPSALVDAWRRGLARVASGEPVQYVLGEWDFRNLTLTVDRRALIPRPETEQLVDLVLGTVELWAEASPLVLDVGTGSGCIALSLAQERPTGRYIGLDASPDALTLARENALRCGFSEVTFRLADGCGEFSAGSVDAIVANLPYITTDDIAGLDAGIREYEPLQALDGGKDGLDIIRHVCRDSIMILRARGWLFLEIGDNQGAAVRDILDSTGLVDIEILPDLAGKTRFAKARHSSV